MSHTLKLANFTGSKADFSPGRGELANGLVFYADLWHPEQQGFCLSYDGNDYLSNATANFRSGDSSGAIEGWARSSSTANNQTLFASSDTGTTTSRIMVYIAQTTGRVTISTQNAAGAVNTVSGTTNVCDGKWFHWKVNSSSTAWDIDINGVAETLIVVAGSNIGDWFADVTLRDNLTVGAMTHTSTVNYAIGVLASTRIYSRTMATAEALTNYQRGWKAIASDTTGLVFNLPCTEGTGNPVDTVIPATMTLTGATWIESLIDRSTNATPISAFGIPTWSNLGRTFDGSTQYIEVPDSDAFNVQNWSIFAWVKIPVAGSVTEVARIFSQQAADYWGIVTKGNKISSLSSLDSITYPSGYGLALNDNACHSLCLVRNTETDLLSHYVDGQNVQDLSATNNGTYNIAAVANIARYSGGTEYYNGTIGELIVYSRALSVTEVGRIHNGTRWRYN